MLLTGKILLIFLSVAALFNPVYFILLGIFSCALLFRVRLVNPPAAKPLSFRFVPHVFGVRLRRLQRAMRSVEGGENSLLKIVPSKRLLVSFAAVTIVSLLAGVVIGVTLVQYRLSGAGKIVIPPGLGVYSDAACSVPVSSLDFGSFGPGENVTRTVYIRNEGSETGILSLTTQNWNPLLAKEYLAFSWNREGAQLPGGDVVEARFNIKALNTLTNESGITTFAFEAVISLQIETEG